MTPPAVRLTKPVFSLATANYVDNAWESVNTARISTNTSWGGSLSADLGVRLNTEQTDNGLQTSAKPFVEAKYNQIFGKTSLFDKDVTFRGYARYRHSGETDQLRFTTGASVKLNKNLSAYIDAHYTTKFQEGKDKAGCWVGISYKFNKHLSAWAEPWQVNVALDGSGKASSLHNFGVTYKF